MPFETLFTNKTLLITGGTGSFGHTVLKHFLETDIGEIRIFSRDEKKQDDMRHELQAQHPEAAKKVKFYIGDEPLGLVVVDLVKAARRDGKPQAAELVLDAAGAEQHPHVPPKHRAGAARVVVVDKSEAKRS